MHAPVVLACASECELDKDHERPFEPFEPQEGVGDDVVRDRRTVRTHEGLTAESIAAEEQADALAGEGDQRQLDLPVDDN